MGQFGTWATSREAWFRWGYGYRRVMGAIALRESIAVQLGRPACPVCLADSGFPCDAATEPRSLLRLSQSPGGPVHLERAQAALAAGFLEPETLKAQLRPRGIPRFLAELEDQEADW